MREVLWALLNFAGAVAVAAAAILYATELGAWRIALWAAVAVFSAAGIVLVIHSIFLRWRSSRVPHTKTPMIREVPAPALFNPARDVGAGEAVAYLCFGEWGKRFFDAAESTATSGAAEYDQFLQGAADGIIPMWGKKEMHRVYEPIPKEFWFKNRIDWFSLLRGDAHSESSTRSHSDRYLSLMTSRAALEKKTITPDQLNAVRQLVPDIDAREAYFTILDRSEWREQQLRMTTDTTHLVRNWLDVRLDDEIHKALVNSRLASWGEEVLASGAMAPERPVPPETWVKVEIVFDRSAAPRTSANWRVRGITPTGPIAWAGIKFSRQQVFRLFSVAAASTEWRPIFEAAFHVARKIADSGFKELLSRGAATAKAGGL